jgi:transcriptional regulator with XRE-family HTH domain
MSKINLKRLREENHLTQEELANNLGLKRYNISDWEQGRTQPDIDSIKKLADYFQVSTDYLLGKSDIRNINNENEDYRIAFDDIGKDYAELEDSEKDMIKTMIKAFKDKHQKK